MVVSEGFARSAVAAVIQEGPVVPADVEFEARWTAWVARGRVHERLVRRRFVVRAAVLATALAIAYAFLHV